jgi:hypothetical protein
MDEYFKQKKNILITSDGNKKSNLRIINLLKLIPKKEEKKYEYKKPKIKTRNLKIFNYQNYIKSPLNKEISKSTKKYIFDSNDNSSISESNIDDFIKKYSQIKNDNKNNFSFINNNNNNKNKNSEKNHYKDNVYNYFRRNFYENDVQIPKKIQLNRQILNYFLQDRKNEEKSRLLKLEKTNSNKYRFNSEKNIFVNENKKDIKESLILDDFRIYNRIHKVLRFWGKLTNFACPLFQVQKFSLNSEQYKRDKIKYSLEETNNNNNNTEKNIKLPKLYTNSTRTINKSYFRKYKLLSKKNKSDVNFTSLNNIN